MTSLTSNAGTCEPALPGLLEAVDAFSQVSVESGTAASRLTDAYSLEHYLEKLARLCDLTGELEHIGLQSACLVYQESIQTLRKRGMELDDQLLSVLEAWPQLVRNYLELPLDSTTVKAITDHLQLAVWDMPLPPQDAEMIDMLFERGFINAEERFLYHKYYPYQENRRFFGTRDFSPIQKAEEQIIRAQTDIAEARILKTHQNTRRKYRATVSFGATPDRFSYK